MYLVYALWQIQKKPLIPQRSLDPTRDTRDFIGDTSDIAVDDMTVSSSHMTSSQAPYRHPYNQDELSVSGSTPDVESDDDTLQNAQDMGMQLEEDSEHPEEIDIARDINKAEEFIKTH